MIDGKEYHWLLRVIFCSADSNQMHEVKAANVNDGGNSFFKKQYEKTMFQI